MPPGQGGQEVLVRISCPAWVTNTEGISFHTSRRGAMPVEVPKPPNTDLKF